MAVPTKCYLFKYIAARRYHNYHLFNILYSFIPFICGPPKAAPTVKRYKYELKRAHTVRPYYFLCSDFCFLITEMVSMGERNSPLQADG